LAKKNITRLKIFSIAVDAACPDKSVGVFIIVLCSWDK
jgi:hypothetical protein